MKRREITPLKLGEYRFPVSTCDVLDRVETLPSGKRVLLPAWCEGGAVRYSTDMLRVVLNDDKCSLLITGETGSGKEAFFECVRGKSHRTKERIREINCAGFSEQLVDSELFGHTRGAFTGATEESLGLVHECEDGILYLDEIGWMPKPVQAKLLRFMESPTGEYRQVGGKKIKSAKNVRIVAATNQDVKKRLLPDFVFRFDHHIGLPSLRERGVDVLWFLSQPGLLGEQNVYTGVSLRTLIAVLCREWKGNVRELAKYCQRKVMFRCCEPGEPNEREFILDDESLAEGSGFCDWVRMTRIALAGAEKEEAEQTFLATIKERLQLLGLLDDIANWRGRNQSREDPDFYSPGLVFDIDGLNERLFSATGYWMTMYVPHWVRDAGGSFQWDDTEIGFSTDDTDSLAGMMLALKSAVKGLCPLDRAKACPQPTKKWLIALWKNETVRGLHVPINPPDPGSILAVLAREGIEGMDKEICLLSHKGQSTTEIKEALGDRAPCLSTIKERLREFRRHAVLGPLLTKATPGRPRNRN